MVWRSEWLIVEYDGAYHLDPDQRARDEARIRRLREAGWTVLVFTSDDLKAYPSMCGKVSAALWRARGYS